MRGTRFQLGAPSELLLRPDDSSLVHFQVAAYARLLDCHLVASPVYEQLGSALAIINRV